MTREFTREKLEEIRNAHIPFGPPQQLVVQLCDFALSLLPASPPPLPEGCTGPFTVNAESGDGWTVDCVGPKGVTYDIYYGGQRDAEAIAFALNHTYPDKEQK